MNVQSIRLRLNQLKKDLREIWTKKDEQTHLMTEEEKLDEEIDESFPASDPPGHFSKSLRDKELH